MEMVIVEFYTDWKTDKRKIISQSTIKGATKEECFKQVYKITRSYRYVSSDYSVEIVGRELNQEYIDWQKDISIGTYYGNATVD